MHELSGAVDAAIHTASPGDATSADLDSAVADAAIEAFAGSGKPYVPISGAWIYGNNTSISESSPIDSPALVAWKEPIQRRILDTTGMRGVIVVSSTAYGDGGGGTPALLLNSPRDDAGNLIMIGSGQQHWSTVHVADLADLFRRVLEDDSASGYYLVGDGRNPTVADLTAAAADAIGAPGAVPGSDDEARALAWAMPSPKSCCWTRAPLPAGLGANSDGPRHTPASSTSFDRGVTEGSRRVK